MKKVTLSFQVLAAMITVAILQACAATTTTGKSQCKTPTLNPSGVTDHVGDTITVRLKTDTLGAKVRYMLTGTTTTTGSTSSETGTVTFQIEVFGRTLTATAYKPGWTDSPSKVGHYGP
jgi:hypothetical protein